jgi:hypothetical protein
VEPTTDQTTEPLLRDELLGSKATVDEPITEFVEPPLRLLPQITDLEAAWQRGLFLCIALAIVAGYFFFLMSFWVPAPGRPGIDENGYLVGGKNIAQHFTTGFKPINDFIFIGAMWIRTPAGWYYPKYPAGTSLLNAIAILVGGARHGHEFAFLVSPICMSLAVLGMFFLTRAIAGSFCGILAMIALATGITSLQRAINPDSHAPALCMVVWGMFLLIRWWQSGKFFFGIAAGLLLGFAVTIRYTEALLLFPLYALDQVLSDTNFAKSNWFVLTKLIRFLPIGPIGLVTLLSVHWKRWSSWWRAMLPIFAWAVPVGILVIFNWFAMGHITGYDTTNESAGFSTAEFLRKGDFAFFQIYVFGLFLLLPLGIAGLVMMYHANWRIALLLTLWWLPGTLLYTAYYWGNQSPGIAFLRFLLTLFPPLIITAVWFLRMAGVGIDASINRIYGSISAPLAAGIIIAITASVGLIATIPELERQQRGNLNLHYSAQRIFARVNPARDPKPPVVFVDEGLFPQLLQYMQFMSDGDWYSIDAFEPRAGGGFGILGVGQLAKADQATPVVLQRERITYMNSVLSGKSAADLIQLQRHVVDDALTQNRNVYAILTDFQAMQFGAHFISGEYEMTRLDKWTEPCTIPDSPPGRPNGSSQSMALAPASWSGEPMIRWKPQTLTLFKITRKSQ